MMTNREIPVGYMIEITTWENDADNYNTIRVCGLNEDEVNFYIDVCQLHYSQYSVKGTKTYGNCSRDEYEPVFEKILEIYSEYKSSGRSVPINFDWSHPTFSYLHAPDKGFDYKDFLSDSLYDIIGWWNYGEYSRVFDKYEVYLVEHPIENVTDRFD